MQQLIKNMRGLCKQKTRRDILTSLAGESDTEIAHKEGFLNYLKSHQGLQALDKHLTCCTTEQLKDGNKACTKVIGRLQALGMISAFEKEFLNEQHIERNKTLVVELATFIRKHITIQLAQIRPIPHSSYQYRPRVLFGVIAIALMSSIGYWWYKVRSADKNNEGTIVAQDQDQQEAVSV
jgi:hypothetical protein